MCLGISAEIGIFDGVLKVWLGDPDCTGPDRDRHEKIRNFHKLKIDNGDPRRHRPPPV